MPLCAQHLPDAAAHIGIIRINQNEQFTTNVDVILELQAIDNGTGVSRMQFSNDDENWSGPEPYQSVKTWQLANDGKYPPQMRTVLKTVFVRFQDGAGNWSKAVSDSIVLARSPADVPPLQEIWIAQQLPRHYNSAAPVGSELNPYLVPASTNEVPFDTLMYSLMTNYCTYQPQSHWTTNPPGPATNTTTLTIHLGPGTYETHGDNQMSGKTLTWHPQSGWRIFGAGRDVTTLKAVDVRYGYTWRVNVIGGFGEYNNFEIADLTIDANIHEGGTNMLGQFSQAMAFCGSNVQIRRVKVKNSGSHMYGAEPAALNLQDWGCEFDNYNLTVEDCEVGHPQIGNAYAPNLVGISGQFGSDGNMRWYRNVVVRNCYCDGTPYDGETAVDPTLYPVSERAQTAFGIGGCWGAVIEDNVGISTGNGYYTDSVSLHSLVVRNNSFRNVLVGAQIGLSSSASRSLILEDSFRFERNLVELDPHLYTQGDNWGSHGFRFAFLFDGNVKGPTDYSLNRVIVTNNFFQFADLQAPDTNVAGVRGRFGGVRTAEVADNVYRGLTRPLTWDNDPQYLEQQADIVDASSPTPMVCRGNTLEDGTMVESYPYVLDKCLSRLVVGEGQEVRLPAPALEDLEPATVADGLPTTNLAAVNGVFRWQTTSQDAGRYVVNFYDSAARHRDPRRTLVTVLDRGPGNDAHYFVNGLMSYWRFNETSGTSLRDSSGNGYSIDASRACSDQLLTLGVAGPAEACTAIHLNARTAANAVVLSIINSDAHLFNGYPVLFHPLLGKGASLYHPLTIAFWFKADSEPPHDLGIFSQFAGGDSFNCLLTPGTNTTDQKVGVRFVSVADAIDQSTPAVYPVGAWHHLAIAYDGVSVRLVVDGVKAADQTCGQLTGFSPASALVLGGGFGWNPYVGSLANLAVWNRALSDGEIARICAEQSAGAAPVLTPVAASALNAQLLSAATAGITWRDNSSNESGFVLERSSNGTNYTVLATLGADTTSYLDTLPVSGGGYYYRVAATNAFGASDYSNLAAVGVPRPSPPTDLHTVPGVAK